MTRSKFPTLALTHWPQRDHDMWRAAMVPTGPFDDDAGLAAGWSPHTIRSCERSYGIWLSWLERESHLLNGSDPTGRITRALIDQFIAQYSIGRAPLTVAGTLRDIAYVLRACAPPEGVPWLTKMAHRRVNTAPSSRPKLPRMAPASVLVKLGDQLMNEGLEDLNRGKRSGAVTYRDGLLFAFLVRRPIRRGELWQMQLGTTLHSEHGKFELNIAAMDTKAGVAPASRIPDCLAAPFQTYLTSVRPILLGSKPDAGWFWLNRHGGRLSVQNITARVAKMGRVHLGKELSPHLFRDCVMTQVALSAPDKIGIAAAVLGHATHATSEKFYNQATSFSGFASHAEAIRMLCEEDNQ